MVATYRNIIKSWPDLPSIMMMIMMMKKMMMKRIVDMLILVTAATTSSGVLFQASAPFSIELCVGAPNTKLDKYQVCRERDGEKRFANVDCNGLM